MAPVQPSPLTWTIRFKHHKSTTLLHVDPLQPLDEVKSELLRALRQTHNSGLLPTGQRIPTDPSDLLLAKPVNAFHYEKGWTRLDGAASAVNGVEDGPSVKKRKMGETQASAKNADDCMKALGLKDNAVLAYKFRGHDVADEDEDEGVDMEEDNWDVVIPSYEDSTGVVNEGDVGSWAHFEG